MYINIKNEGEAGKGGGAQEKAANIRAIALIVTQLNKMTSA